MALIPTSRDTFSTSNLYVAQLLSVVQSTKNQETPMAGVIEVHQLVSGELSTSAISKASRSAPISIYTSKWASADGQ